jgi:UDP-N-acetylmuramyl pentapeptide phosphotransferase/UDP-N-acetylglucosamine-1-phosphate transferase
VGARRAHQVRRPGRGRDDRRVAGRALYWIPSQGAFSLNPAQAYIFSVLFIVATVNAVNFIDGLDGLAAGVVLIGAP